MTEQWKLQMALRVRAFAVSILAPRIRRQQLMLFSMFPHLFLLVSTNPQRGARFAGTQQYETGVTIFGKIDQGIRLVYFASILQPSCTRQAIALMAKRRPSFARARDLGVPVRMPRVFARQQSHAWARILMTNCTTNNRVTDYRTARSYCTARVLAPRGGSVRTEWFCRRAPSPAAR